MTVRRFRPYRDACFPRIKDTYAKYKKAKRARPMRNILLPILVICILVLCPLALAAAAPASEPQDRSEPAPKYNHIGIDLGASHIRVGYTPEGNITREFFWCEKCGPVELLPPEVTREFDPPRLGFVEQPRLLGLWTDSNLQVGSNGTFTVDVRPLIGRTFTEIESLIPDLPYTVVRGWNDRILVPVTHDGQTENCTPDEILTAILTKVRFVASQYLGVNIENAVISVPIDYVDKQRIAVKEAAAKAGLNVGRMMHAPTSAGMAYGLDMNVDDTHAVVYDLSDPHAAQMHLVEIDMGVFELLATATTNKLSKMDSTLAELDPADATITLDLLKQILHDGRRYYHEDTISIQDLIFIGPSHRIPVLAPVLETHLNITALRSAKWGDDEAVAVGLTRQACRLFSDCWEETGCILMMDVNILGLGIETAGGVMDKLVPRYIPIPFRAQRNVTTMEDGQTSVVVRLFEGERPLTKQNNFLYELELEVAPAPKGVPMVEVTVEVDANGVVNVTLSDLETGKRVYKSMENGQRMNSTMLEEYLVDVERHVIEDRVTVADIEMSNAVGGRMPAKPAGEGRERCRPSTTTDVAIRATGEVGLPLVVGEL